MTKLPHQAPGDTNNTQDSDLQPGLLRLHGQNPKQVYVGSFMESGTEVAGFASSESGPFFKDGIKWKFQPNSEYSMFVTFKFLTGVQSVDCDGLQYSPPHGANQDKQDLAIPPSQGDFSFTVTFSSGDRHDPQIVVTPIGNQNDDD